jgi:hypothetical protein
MLVLMENSLFVSTADLTQAAAALPASGPLEQQPRHHHYPERA